MKTFDYPTLKNQLLIVIDPLRFKKTDEERGKLYTHKKKLGKTKHHKFVTEMRAAF